MPFKNWLIISSPVFLCQLLTINRQTTYVLFTWYIPQSLCNVSVSVYLFIHWVTHVTLDTLITPPCKSCILWISFTLFVFTVLPVHIMPAALQIFFFLCCPISTLVKDADDVVTFTFQCYVDTFSVTGVSCWSTFTVN